MDLPSALTPPETAPLRSAEPDPGGTARRQVLLTAGFAASLLAAVLFLALPGADNPTGDVAAATATARGKAPDVAAMVERLAQRLKENPDNGAGWLMLARSYAALGRFAEAVPAFRKAAGLLPGDAGLLADYADALAATQGSRFDGEPRRLIEEALAVSPNHPKALALAGYAALQDNHPRAAADYWNRALRTLPADSELAATLRQAAAGTAWPPAR